MIIFRRVVATLVVCVIGKRRRPRPRPAIASGVAFGGPSFQWDSIKSAFLPVLGAVGADPLLVIVVTFYLSLSTLVTCPGRLHPSSATGPTSAGTGTGGLLQFICAALCSILLALIVAQRFVRMALYRVSSRYLHRNLAHFLCKLYSGQTASSKFENESAILEV